MKELLDQKSIMKQALNFRMEGLGIILHKIQNTFIIINEKDEVLKDFNLLSTPIRIFWK